VKQTACGELAELGSAYLDGALGDADRERVLAHLVNCASCRREIEDLRTVRQVLGRVRTSATGVPASRDLAERLVSIAGPDAHSPVWCRPFRRTRTGALPKARRAVKLRATAAAVAVGAMVSTVAGVGVAAAPAVNMAPITDPSDRVRSEFASMLTSIPLTSRSVNALMIAPTSDLQSTASSRVAVTEVSPASRRMSAAAARVVLLRAASRANLVSYSGLQRVLASVAGKTVQASVKVDFEVGQGSQVSVFGSSGQVVVSGFVPLPSSSRIMDGDWLSDLLGNYLLSGWTGAEVAGRPATVIEAEPAAGRNAVQARWWIDNATGLLLWQETYDPSGKVLLASGFTQVSIHGKSDFIAHFAPRLAVTTTTTSLTVSQGEQLISHGWFCPNQLSGLPLVRLRSDLAVDPTAVHLVFGDGVSTLSVFEQRGRLSGPPADSRWDSKLHAYLSVGAPSLATWQSGDTVFTVVTDGPTELLTNAVTALPHRAPATRTTLEKVQAGWVRIFNSVIG
jgi:Putative zinc-finger/MucB/RseB N-terminal domain